MIKLFATLCLAITCFSSFAAPLKIATFNIRWYGTVGVLEDQQRDAHLKKFISQNLADRDVIIFQEIVDVKRLDYNVLGWDFKCLTYKNNQHRHQHIVLCHKNNFKFIKEKYKRDYALNSVKAGRSGLRPGLVGILVEKKSNRKLAHIMGVHLKAFIEETELRLEQTEAIADFYSKIDDDLPVIIAGDFNTHISENTDYEKDDITYMKEILGEYDTQIKHVYNRSGVTYRSSEGETSELDHFFVSKNVKIITPPKTYKACTNPNGRGYGNFKFYRQFISDHCPVLATFDI